jgi:peptidoglycan/xylan/chitin deacetylase (PgdA/CDA1 family)
MRLLLFLLALGWSGNVLAQKELAVTIDDLPFLYGRWLPEQEEHLCFREILAVLKKHQVTVMAFVVGSRVSESWAPLLDELVAEGHTVANHTFTHPDLNETAAHWYLQDIARCDSAIRPWLDTTKYFRYPYLHRGSTPEKYDAVQTYLIGNGYTVVPVTIDNDDWRFNKDYVDAMRTRDTAAAQAIGIAYLEHMKEQTAEFEKVAAKTYKRPVRHILLLHMTELNSVYLDTLLSWYETEGWRFITTQEALTDSLYSMPEPYRGTNGISWLLRF